MITAPGIYEVSSDAYHADCAPMPSLSSSVASILLNQSPWHAWLAHAKLNPNYQPDFDSRFDLGSAAHALLLENDGTKICVIEAADFRTKDAKAKRDEARANGLHPVLAKHNFILTKMVNAAREFIETTELKGVFNVGHPEQTIVWQEADVWCRARLDWLTNDGGLILEYKSTESAQPDQFIRQIGRMGYAEQAEFYRRGLKAINAVADANHVILAQEISAPFACSLVSLDNAYREVAQRRIEEAIAIWRRCMKAGSWPGYDPRIHYAAPSAWQVAEVEAALRQEW